MHIEAGALQQVVFAISSHKCPPPICIKLTPTLVADYVFHERFFVREAGNVLDDHNNNYDDDRMGQITMTTIMVMLMVMTVSLTGCVRAGREVT